MSEAVRMGSEVATVAAVATLFAVTVFTASEGVTLLEVGGVIPSLGGLFTSDGLIGGALMIDAVQSLPPIAAFGAEAFPFLPLPPIPSKTAELSNGWYRGFGE